MTRVLNRGDKGEDVLAYQKMLVSKGFMTQAELDTGPGIFGPRTEAATRKLQEDLIAKGLLSREEVAGGYGHYGPKTSQAYEKSLGTLSQHEIQGINAAIAGLHTQQEGNQGRTARRPVVVLDSGHGDYTAHGHLRTGAKEEGVQEYKVNQAITAMVKEDLERRGFTVHLTSEQHRKQAYQESLTSRAQFAEQQDADLFISIHANSSAHASAKGARVYVYENKDEGIKTRPESAQFGRAMAHALDRNDCVKNNYVVLDSRIHGDRPAILVETGFLTNDNDRKRLTSTSGQREVAAQIVQGIEKYSISSRLIDSPVSSPVQMADRSYDHSHPSSVPDNSRAGAATTRRTTS